MPQFYLNVCDGRERLADPRAYEFPTLSDARNAAIKVAREVLQRPELDLSDVASKQIEIADPEGHTLATVRVDELLH